MIDNRYDPPRISPWRVVALVAFDVACVAFALGAGSEGRWVGAVVFAVGGVGATVAELRLQRRHRAAFADWTPPARHGS